MFFTDKGKCYWVKVYDIPEGGRAAKGRAIVNLIFCCNKHVSVVNALAEDLTAEVHRDGFHYKQEYKIGEATTPVEKMGKSSKRGTIITFKPDHSIFTHRGFQEDTIKGRLKELAYLNKNLSITLKNEVENTSVDYCFPWGIIRFCKIFSWGRRFNTQRSYCSFKRRH